MYALSFKLGTPEGVQVLDEFQFPVVFAPKSAAWAAGGRQSEAIARPARRIRAARSRWGLIEAAHGVHHLIT